MNLKHWLILLSFFIIKCQHSVYRVGLVWFKTYIPAHEETKQVRHGRMTYTEHEHVNDLWTITTTDNITIEVPQNVYNHFHYHDKIMFRDTYDIFIHYYTIN